MPLFKRFGSILLIGLLGCVGSLGAASIEGKMQVAVDSLATKYSESKRDLVSRQATAVLPIKNLSKSAEANFIGETAREFIKKSLQNSLVFKSVDRDNFDNVMKELQLSQTGLIADGKTVNAGEMEGVVLFITGNVIETGEKYKVIIQLIDVATSAVVATAESELPKEDMIQTAQDTAFAYVTANGIGLSIRTALVSMWPSFITPTINDPEMKGQPNFMGAAGLTYRINRHFKISVIPAFSADTIYGDTKKISESKNILSGANAYTNGFWYNTTVGGKQWYAPFTSAQSNAFDYCFKSSYSLAIETTGVSLLFGYVIPFTRSLNLSLSGGPSAGMASYHISLRQIPQLVGKELRNSTYDIRIDRAYAGGMGDVALEWFFRPRLALNVGASYAYIYTFGNSDNVNATVNGKQYNIYTKGKNIHGHDYITEAFDLDPFMRPDGEKSYDYNPSYLALYLGFSIYF